MKIAKCVGGALVGSVMTLGTAVAAKEYRMATVVPEASPYGQVMAAWSKTVADRTNGDIEVKIFFNGALGEQIATLRQAQRGRLEAAGVSINALATVLPEVSLMLEPYLFSSDAVRNCVEDNHFDEIFGDRLEAANYIIVGRLDIGREHIFSKDPVTHPSDLSGVKMSVPSAPSFERLIASAGASVTTMGATEIVPGLKTGAVNGAMASAIYSILIGVPQLATNAVDPGAVSSAGLVGFSKKTWDSFSAEQQKIIRDTSDEMFNPFRQVVAGMEAALIAKAVEGGMVYNEMSDAAKADFKALADAGRDDFLKGLGGTAVDDYAALAAAAEACAG